MLRPIKELKDEARRTIHGNRPDSEKNLSENQRASTILLLEVLTQIRDINLLLLKSQDADAYLDYIRSGDASLRTEIEAASVLMNTEVE